jgi:hypothetical protein
MARGPVAVDVGKLIGGRFGEGYCGLFRQCGQIFRGGGSAGRGEQAIAHRGPHAHAEEEGDHEAPGAAAPDGRHEHFRRGRVPVRAA